jgi:hypothetical protein
MKWPGEHWYGNGARNMLAARMYSPIRGVHALPCASIAQLAEHAHRKRTVVGSIPTGGFAYLFLNCLLDRGTHSWPRPSP